MLNDLRKIKSFIQLDDFNVKAFECMNTIYNATDFIKTDEENILSFHRNDFYCIAVVYDVFDFRVLNSVVIDLFKIADEYDYADEIVKSICDYDVQMYVNYRIAETLAHLKKIK